MKVFLDPTQDATTTLRVQENDFEKIFHFPHTRHDSGISLTRKIASLKISAKDELNIVVGPGNFTAIRSACLIGNAVQFLTACRLFSKQKKVTKFKATKKVTPFYACEASITTPKKR